MNPERLTPTNDQIGMLSEGGASYRPATGDTYCQLNTLNVAPTGVYSALVPSSGSSSMPSYANILALEIPLHHDKVSSMVPTSAAFGNTAPTYENAGVGVVHYIAPTSYGNTVST